MKGNGLSSTTREALKKLNRRSNFASLQVGYLVERERQKEFRLQAEKAWIDSQKRELQRKAATAESENSLSLSRL